LGPHKTQEFELVDQFTDVVDQFILKLADAIVNVWRPGLFIALCTWVLLRGVAYLLRRNAILIRFDKSTVSITSLKTGRKEHYLPEVAVQDLKGKESSEWKLPERYSDLSSVNPFSHARCLFIDTEIAGHSLALMVAKHHGNPYFFLRPPIILTPIGLALEDLASYELSEIQKLGKLAGGRNPVLYFGEGLDRYDDIKSSSDEKWYPRKPKWI
jgi:hypothetical protein